MSDSKSYKTSRAIHTCIAVLLTVVLVGTSIAGIGRSGISGGRISKFASIFVNDREFDTANAAVTIDGRAATADDLKLGQSVFVDGILDDELLVGVADQVIANTGVRGSISSNAGGQITVLGTSVLTDVDTLVETLTGNKSVNSLATGDLVSVSGLRSSAGSLLATRIDQLVQVSDLLVTGTVTSLSATTFQINALPVDFGNAALSGFPAGTIRAGDDVRVRGLSLGAGGELLAATVEFLTPVSGVGEELGEFEGLISDFTSPADFSVSGVQIVVDGNTGFIGGGPANLTNNTNVVIRGGFDAAGILLANEVTIRGTRIRVYGEVDSVSSSSLTVLGVPLIVVPATELKDDSEAEVEPFSLDDISAGDFVESRSFRNPPHAPAVVTARIERIDEEEEIRLQGFVDVVSGQRLHVLGAFVDVDSETEYEGANDEEISAAEFFNAVTPGTFVKIRGYEASSLSIRAEEIELGIDD